MENETLEAKKARYAEWLEKHGPNDGAVVELGAEIERAENPTEKPAPNLDFGRSSTEE